MDRTLPHMAVTLLLIAHMARIFNIYFSYDDLMYNAVVSVRTTPFFTEYSLINFHEDLLKLLPGNKIISRNNGEYVFPGTVTENPLMAAIIKAVAEHMHTTEV